MKKKNIKKVEENVIPDNCKKLPVTERGLATHIDGCPMQVREFKGQAYANLTDDCFCCEFFHGDEYIPLFDESGEEYNEELKYIYCSGGAEND